MRRKDGATGETAGEASSPVAGVALGLASAAAGLVVDPMASAADLKRVALLVVAAAALALLGRWPARSVHPVAMSTTLTPTALLWSGFVAWSALTLWWGLPSGRRDVASWAAAAGLLLAALRLPVGEARAAVRIAATTLGGGAALWAVAQRLGGAGPLFIDGGQGNSNWLGLLLALTLPLTAEGVSARDRRSAAVAALAVTAQLVGLGLSHSRVAWAASLVGLAVGLSVWRRVRLARALLALALIGIGLWALVQRPIVVGEGAGRGDVPLPLAWAGRVRIWQTASEAAVRVLPLGAGQGRFAHLFLDEQGARLATRSPQQAAREFVHAGSAHDEWLEVLVEGGVPSLLLLVGAFAASLRSMLRGGWAAGSAAMAALGVCASGDSPLRQPAILGMVALIWAAAPRAPPAHSPSLRPAAKADRRGAPLVLATLVTVAALLVGAVATWRADRRLTAAREALPDARLRLLGVATRIDPGSGEAALDLGLARLALDDAGGALVELERSRDLLADHGTDVAIGNAHVVLGRPAAAAAAYRLALRRHPGSLRAHANLAEAERLVGHALEAEIHLAIARTLQPNHPKLRAF